MSEPISLLIVTGTRADFGLWLPVIREAEHRGMKVRLVVTAMHLDERFGHTVEEVRASGCAIAAEVPCTARGDTKAEMALALATALAGITPVLEAEPPDWLLVLGDRDEQLAAGLAALHVGIPIAHLHGGERTLGVIDDVIRDMLSRMANLHFVANAAARDRLISLGVPPLAVEISGAPGLDAILQLDAAQDTGVHERYGVKSGQYLLVVQHPETVGSGDPVEHLTATLNAVREQRQPTIAIFPNADAGGRAIGEALATAAGEFVGLYRSIPHAEFLQLLAGAAAIVGNSSSALIEAPALRVPAVNVGRRQEGRTRGDNVIDVPLDASAIADGIRQAVDPKFRMVLSGTSPYGDGHAAPRIVARIAESTPERRVA